MNKSKRMMALGVAFGMVMTIFSPGLRAEEAANKGVSITIKDLGGTWKHVSTSQTPDGKREPTKTSTITWTFKADGTGTYRQIVPSIKMDQSMPLHWKLEGQKILLQSASHKTITTYTVVQYSPTAMTWKNNRLGDYYHLVKK